MHWASAGRAMVPPCGPGPVTWKQPSWATQKFVSKKTNQFKKPSPTRFGTPGIGIRKQSTEDSWVRKVKLYARSICDTSWNLKGFSSLFEKNQSATKILLSCDGNIPLPTCGLICIISKWSRSEKIQLAYWPYFVWGKTGYKETKALKMLLVKNAASSTIILWEWVDSYYFMVV